MSENNIELRSEEVQEIIGRSPAWLVRYGILSIVTVLFILFFGSTQFSYPDIVSAEVSITTENPPAVLVAKRSGTIDTLLLYDGQLVSEGQLIAYMDNSLKLSDYLKLKSYFKQSADSLMQKENALQVSTLGGLNVAYEAFQKTKEELMRFLALGFLKKQQDALQKRKQLLMLDAAQKERQIKLKNKELALYRKRWMRDSLLLHQGVIAKREAEKTEESYVSILSAYENARSAQIGIELQIANVEQELLNKNIEYENQYATLLQHFHLSYDNLLNDLANWEEQYLFIATVSGKLSYSAIKTERKNLVQGDKAFTIIPKTTGNLLGQLKLPFNGAGKVKNGQLANVKFSSYPYMEYGMVKAELNALALVPEEDFYHAELIFPDSLRTNYGKNLQFRQGMKGIAEIITEEQPLLLRMLAPLRSLVVE